MAPLRPGDQFEFAREDVMPSFDGTPDLPERFGYKVSWLAVRTRNPVTVINALELGEAVPANWTSGLTAAYDHSRDNDPWMFVSPPVDGWILAISGSLPYPTAETHHDIGNKFDALFSRLLRQFDDVQYFGSYRVSDFVAWARAVNGKLVRGFAYASEVLTNIGDQTPEEAKLGFVDLTGLSASDAEEKLSRIAGEQIELEEALVAKGMDLDEAQAKVREGGRYPFPNEDDVIELAGLWSVHPSQLLDQDDPTALGLAVRLPENLRL